MWTSSNGIPSSEQETGPESVGHLCISAQHAGPGWSGGRHYGVLNEYRDNWPGVV